MRSALLKLHKIQFQSRAVPDEDKALSVPGCFILIIIVIIIIIIIIITIKF